MAINRSIAFAASLGVTGAIAYAPLVGVLRWSPQDAPPAQLCRIDTKSCANVSKVRAGLCLLGTPACPLNGKLVSAASPAVVVVPTAPARK
jgi:hypothetical protein